VGGMRGPFDKLRAAPYPSPSQIPFGDAHLHLYAGASVAVGRELCPLMG